MKQCTINKEVMIDGVGMHTGKKTHAVFKPAPANYGIRFVRNDMPGKPEIRACLDNVTGVIRGTSLGHGKTEVQTVEHIIAAAYGLGIDNLRVELDTNEPPIGDGSAQPFVELFEKSGIRQLDESRVVWRLKEPVSYSQGKVFLVALPSAEFRISCTIQYDHPLIGNQFLSLDINKDTFKNEIAPARTFGFEDEVKQLKSRGFARGGNLTNAIVIGRDRILNESLRFPDEPVRHKIMDLMGDIFLIEKYIQAHIIAVRCGHIHNTSFTRMLARTKIEPLEQPASIVTVQETTPAGGINIRAGTELGRAEIQQIIPHRPPFLFVDRVIIIDPLTRAIGYKFLSDEEYFFAGHFPDNPITPGALIVEAMAQTACVLFLARPDLKHLLPYFMAIKNAKFRKPVFPGSEMRMEIEVIHARERSGIVSGKCFVNEQLTTEMEFMFSLVEQKKGDKSQNEYS